MQTLGLKYEMLGARECRLSACLSFLPLIRRFSLVDTIVNNVGVSRSRR